jgi:hypothetical protein
MKDIYKIVIRPHHAHTYRVSLLKRERIFFISFWMELAYKRGNYSFCEFMADKRCLTYGIENIETHKFKT